MDIFSTDDPGRAEGGPAVLVCAACYGDAVRWERARAEMENLFGPIEMDMEPFPFNHTTYYEREMGKNLRKLLLSFKGYFPPKSLAAAKRAAISIEDGLRGGEGRGRSVNIDPGYLTLSRLVLASTKDFAHRLYLGRGIFGEVTLVFQGRAFRPVPWTYPDYVEPAVLEFLSRVREGLMARSKASGPVAAGG